MSDKPLTGVKMAINGVGGAMKWSISEKADENKIVTSDSSGATDRADGNTDWSGDYQALGHTPATMPGNTFTGTFSIDGASGASGSAIVDSVDIVIDQEGNKPIEHTVKFSADGDLTIGTAAVTVGTPVAKLPSQGLLVKIGDTTIPRVKKVTLTISCENTKYADSETDGTYSRVPGVVDWTASIDCYVVDPADLPKPNDVAILKIYVTSTLYWELKWGKFIDPGNLQVDASGQPVSVTLQCSMAAINGTERGSIKTPAGSTFWPATTSAPAPAEDINDDVEVQSDAEVPTV